MKYAMFQARCPFEIGDKIAKDEAPWDIYEIEDILAVHSVKKGTVEFKFMVTTELDDVIEMDLRGFKIVKEDV